MNKLSRRSFLALLGASSAYMALAPRSLAFPDPDGEFEMLVVGDSLVWGQGLKEDEKFYGLTKTWLRDDIFKGNRKVNVKVMAHSGATIKLSEEERTALHNAGKDGTKRYHPEINLSFPTIEKQIDLALHDYKDPSAVDLVMLSGGVPEVGVSNILNPFKSDEKLRADIRLYCFEHMSELLTSIAGAFPSALIAVVGYYPIITRHTPVKRIVNDILELYNWPGWTKPMLNNPVNRILWRRYRRRMIARSNIWFDGSTLELTRAVNALNTAAGQERAVFVPTGFGREHGYGSQNTYLWKIAEKGKAADKMREEREAECRPTLDVLREKADLKYRTRVCELASIGHPNAAGANAIAAAIRETLRPHLESRYAEL